MKNRKFNFVIAIVSFMASLAYAETCDEVGDLINDAYRYNVSRVESDCKRGGDERDCVRGLVGVVCSYNGLTEMAGENGNACLGRHMRDLNGILHVIEENSDRMNALINAGVMENPVSMSGGERKAYCRSMGAVAWPW